MQKDEWCARRRPDMGRATSRDAVMEYVRVHRVTAGQSVATKDIIAWCIDQPGFAHIAGGMLEERIGIMTTNLPRRTQRNVSRSGLDDVFFLTNSGDVRLYVPDSDPVPLMP